MILLFGLIQAFLGEFMSRKFVSHKRIAGLTGIALMVIFGLFNGQPVQAQGLITHVNATCESVTVTGSSDQSQIVLDIFDDNGYEGESILPLPGHKLTTFSITKTFSPYPNGNLIGYTYKLHEVTANGVEYDLMSAAVNCVTPDSGAQPTSFGQALVTCTTSMYDAPNGQIVAGEQVVKGDMWYIELQSVVDAKGKSWSKLYGADADNRYIPTTCLNIQ